MTKTNQTLTALEITILRRMVTNEFSAGEFKSTWSFAVCQNHADSAVFGSLCKKGLTWTQSDPNTAESAWF